eukprot:SAG31_NODE_25674_length_456_cov_3.826331_1_plen_111_part_01
MIAPAKAVGAAVVAVVVVPAGVFVVEVGGTVADAATAGTTAATVATVVGTTGLEPTTRMYFATVTAVSLVARAVSVRANASPADATVNDEAEVAQTLPRLHITHQRRCHVD